VRGVQVRRVLLLEVEVMVVWSIVFAYVIELSLLGRFYGG
jgi:hypothetical protein